MVISRRSFLAVPVPMFLSIACGSRSTTGYRGYAFVANEDGQAVAAVDLKVLAVARHIALDASPSQVVAALCSDSGSMKASSSPQRLRLPLATSA